MRHSASSGQRPRLVQGPVATAEGARGSGRDCGAASRVRSSCGRQHWQACGEQLRRLAGCLALSCPRWSFTACAASGSCGQGPWHGGSSEAIGLDSKHRCSPVYIIWFDQFSIRISLFDALEFECKLNAQSSNALVMIQWHWLDTWTLWRYDF